MTTKKCEKCGGRMVQTGTHEGLPVWNHVSKKKQKECLRLWAMETNQRRMHRMNKTLGWE